MPWACSAAVVTRPPHLGPATPKLTAGWGPRPPTRWVACGSPSESQTQSRLNIRSYHARGILSTLRMIFLPCDDRPQRKREFRHGVKTPLFTTHNEWILDRSEKSENTTPHPRRGTPQRKKRDFFLDPRVLCSQARKRPKESAETPRTRESAGTSNAEPHRREGI